MTNGFWIWKTAHILSAGILFGGGIAIACFCWFGYRNALKSGKIESLRTVLRFTTLADAFLTAPAVIFQAISGFVLAKLLGVSMAGAWAIAAWSLFIFIGLCWLPVVGIQLYLSDEARRSMSIQALPGRFHRWFRVWFALGVPAFAAIVLLFYLMIAKPLPLS
jgi:uncharacterized membrane protein